MPGYRSLPDSLSGAVADLTRQAALLEEQRAPLEAVTLYEQALDAAVAEDAAMPGFLCGRLALLYRQLGRHHDEVALIERYQSSQRSERERVRFDARLSKAKALLDKARPSEECGALSSIRAIRAIPRPARNSRR
ncbi:MAG: hypothetical protein V4550_20080 [Gemmatimonadota bacterium]